MWCNLGTHDIWDVELRFKSDIFYYSSDDTRDVMNGITEVYFSNYRTETFRSSYQNVSAIHQTHSSVLVNNLVKEDWCRDGNKKCDTT